MLKSTPLLPSESLLNILPVSIAILICQAKEDDVSLLGKELGFLSGESKIHILIWISILLNFLLYHIRSA